jgi:hypothetical protein
LTQTTYDIGNNKKITFSINNSTARREFKIQDLNKTEQFSIEYGYYQSFAIPDSQPSGFYTFRVGKETLNEFKPYGFSKNKNLTNATISIGKLVTVIKFWDNETET